MDHADTLRELLARRKFKPFTVHLTRGARHTVTDAAHAFVNSKSLIIGSPTSDKVLTCPLVRIIRIET